MTPILPTRDSPTWKECKSTMIGNPALVRAQPTRLATITHKIYEGDTFWIDTTVTAKADTYTWYAVKTVSVVGWCASPPLTYTLVPPEPPPPDDEDTEQLPPPNTDAPLVTPLLTTDEIRQTITAFAQMRDAMDEIHLQVAKFRNAVDEQIRIFTTAIERGQGL